MYYVVLLLELLVLISLPRVEFYKLMIGVNKYFIMNWVEKIIKKYNLMEHKNLKMKNGQHTLLFMDGMFWEYGLHYQLDVILMLLIDLIKVIYQLQQMIILESRYSDILLHNQVKGIRDMQDMQLMLQILDFQQMMNTLYLQEELISQFFNGKYHMIKMLRQSKIKHVSLFKMFRYQRIITDLI